MNMHDHDKEKRDIMRINDESMKIMKTIRWYGVHKIKRVNDEKIEMKRMNDENIEIMREWMMKEIEIIIISMTAWWKTFEMIKW